MTPIDHVPPGRGNAGNLDPSFVGKGIRFPLAIGPNGSIAFADAGESTDSAIRVVLSTAPGERVMRPGFGCRIWDLLFEPVNANTVGLMAEAVRQAIAQWEPRVDVEEVSVVPDDDEQALVRIHLRYKMRATNDRRNLVYPFYVIPRESNEGGTPAVTDRPDREQA
ncbi:MAG TPA: GPW/gp25 family protein [Acidimicrobiales bacterium]|nr:GPW/gp25 family protein [Acidimicrobiales bacterium]